MVEDYHAGPLNTIVRALGKQPVCGVGYQEVDMRLDYFTVKNFRSIKKQKRISLKSNYTTFTGANNCGKSNFLRALNLYFNGIVDDEPFSASTDMHNQTTEQKQKEQTNVTCTFKLDVKTDSVLREKLEKLKRDNAIRNYNLDSLSVSYSLRSTNTSLVQYIDPVTGQRTQSAQILDFFEAGIRRNVDFLYVPAIKDIRTFINKEVSNELLKRIFNTWGGSRNPEAKKLITRFDRIKDDMMGIVGTASSNITHIMKEQFPSLSRFLFSLPYKDIIEFLSFLPISIDDGEVTAIRQKGSGVQAIAIYSILRYLDRYKPTNKYASAQYIWAIEEPETFLHPDAQKQLYEALRGYSEAIQILSTTHSYYFLNATDLDSNVLLEKKKLDSVYSETDIVSNPNRKWEPYLRILGDFRPTFIPAHGTDVVYFFCEGAVDIEYVVKLAELYPDIGKLMSGYELVDGNGEEIVKRAYDASCVFKLKTKVLVDGDEKGRRYADALEAKGFVRQQSLFQVQIEGVQNPTIESMCTQKKLDAFKHTMPKDAKDYWYAAQSQIEFLFDNTQRRPPQGWDKGSLKRKLCEYMKRHGDAEDFKELYRILKPAFV